MNYEWILATAEHFHTLPRTVEAIHDSIKYHYFIGVRANAPTEYKNEYHRFFENEKPNKAGKEVYDYAEQQRIKHIDNSIKKIAERR